MSEVPLAHTLVGRKVINSGSVYVIESVQLDNAVKCTGSGSSYTYDPIVKFRSVDDGTLHHGPLNSDVLTAQALIGVFAKNGYTLMDNEGD